MTAVNPVPLPQQPQQSITYQGPPIERVWVRFFTDLSGQAVGGTFNETGTGLISPSPDVVALDVPVSVANGGTDATVAGGGALDNITGFAATGFLERTGAATYAFVADPLPVLNGGTGHTTAGGALLDTITGFSSTGFLERTGAGAYSFVTDPLPVAKGGTAAAAASGTALDNITGFSGVGLIARNGAGSYSFLSYPDVIPRWVTPPAAAGSSGTTGQIAQDGSFLYVCIAANSWTRVGIAAW